MQERSEPKKLALIYILNILRSDTDSDHPLKQEELVELLATRYGVILERKAVGRNLALLRDAGYEITGGARGVYLADRDFEPSELRLLIDSVLFSKHINPAQSRDLSERLAALGGKHFDMHRKHVATSTAGERNKNQHSQLFYAIELAEEAIEHGRRLHFSSLKYGPDKKLHKSSENSVSPYQMILQNQHYYLMAYSARHDKVSFFRMDKMSDVRIERAAAVPLRTLPGYEGGLDYRELTSSLPYMFSDRPIPVTFLCEGWLIDQVIDWFGYGVDIRADKGQDRYRVTVRVSAAAMEYWALQYAKHVRILAPSDLRARLAEVLRAAAEDYGKNDEETP